ncbi:dihydropteroate synthase [Kurthia sibirica]|uniref:Dihydropteroate synthase n=1 Tax=Kurthia sibirica TaxID=202750 RepID=A0A2U3AII0_9BACL|nr:dihydropteroate synthase [Kurthia sibirica]PWI24261.1 dihydropteroate synthase [Kurthia sibirica]GEK34506.1 dihydropteroate synthase [Kurthia sibirica]
MKLRYATDYTIAGKVMDFGEKTHIMGILNITPDSFSDGGRYNSVEAAVERARQMVEQGATIIDIGGESTRPGYTPVSIEEEIARVVPVIEAIVQQVDVLISIDTFKSHVAEQAVLAGAHIINDIWGGQYDPKIATIAAQYKVPLILMHNRKEEYVGDAFWLAVEQDIVNSITLAKQAGVQQIWLDPGIGFGKTHAQNIEMMRKLPELVNMGYPVLLATSRKRMIGTILDLPVEERMEGTGASCCYGVDKGCHIVRVHDVQPIARMMKMMDALR